MKTAWDLLQEHSLEELERMYPNFYEDYVQGKSDA